MGLFNVLLIAFFIVTTAYFVASEFAIVRVRETRIEQLADEGSRNAKAALLIIRNLDGYLSACQLGITITALGLGWVGEPTVDQFLSPLLAGVGLPTQFSTVLSIAISFSVITFLHVVAGELAPKTIAIHKTEAVCLATARPLTLFYKVMFPAIWMLNGAARTLVRWMGLKQAQDHEIAHTEEEIRSILNQSYTSGTINQEELKYMNNIFQFDDRLAKEIMVPRMEISVLDTDSPMDEHIRRMRLEKFTRFPVALKGDKDQIIGIVNTKELFLSLLESEVDSIQEFIRPVISVPETTLIRDLLKKMQKQGNHMAVLIDEYGGTAGLVTVEDILEEIVGEIRDEFDKEEEPLIQELSPRRFIVDGKVLVTDINELMDSDLDDDEIDTIGGWVYTHAPELREGLEVTQDDISFKIVDLDHHRIKKVEIRKSDLH